MKKFYLVISTLSVFIGISAQEVKWQKDISSSTQDFLSGMTATIDRQDSFSGISLPVNSASACQVALRESDRSY